MHWSIILIIRWSLIRYDATSIFSESQTYCLCSSQWQLFACLLTFERLRGTRMFSIEVVRNAVTFSWTNEFSLLLFAWRMSNERNKALQYVMSHVMFQYIELRATCVACITCTWVWFNFVFNCRRCNILSVGWLVETYFPIPSGRPHNANVIDNESATLSYDNLGGATSITPWNFCTDTGGCRKS